MFFLICLENVYFLFTRCIAPYNFIICIDFIAALWYNYNIWFCGHYHIDKQLDKINMLCNDIRPLHLEPSGDEK